MADQKRLNLTAEPQDVIAALALSGDEKKYWGVQAFVDPPGIVHYWFGENAPDNTGVRGKQLENLGTLSFVDDPDADPPVAKLWMWVPQGTQAGAIEVNELKF